MTQYSDPPAGENRPADKGGVPKAEPVGQGDHVVGDGECIYSIAYTHGFFWKTVWELGENRDLREKRKNPNALQVGDKVSLPPEKRPRQESRASDARHKFKIKGVPVIIRLKLMKDAPPPEKKSDASGGGDGSLFEDPPHKPYQAKKEPRKNEPYIIEIDGRKRRGQTDGDGMLEEKLSPGVRSAILTLDPGKPGETVIPLNLGDLRPGDDSEGVRRRLNNMGFNTPEGGSDESFASAVAAFQEQNGLDVTGKADEKTVRKITEIHGD